MSTNLALQGQETRAGQIEQAREEKEARLQPYEMPKPERRLVEIQNKWLEPIFGDADGLHLRLGGMETGSGFALGPEYKRTDLYGGKIAFRVKASGSAKGWYQGSVETSVPRLLAGHAFVDLRLVHRDFDSMPYYGPGPDSEKSGRSNYRLEDTSFELRPGVRPFNGFRAEFIGGLLAVNVGPGADSRFISTERQFGPTLAPGIEQQTSFWKGGAFAEYDWRNYPAHTTRGGFYSLQFMHHADRARGSYSFDRLDLEARQFLPFFNGKRVIALHGLSSLTNTSSGQQVPFYLQPALGGSHDMRGYRPFRFRGGNSMATTIEYRWEASTALEVALFVDAGKVFDQWSHWGSHGIETDCGFGVRFKNKNSPAVRIDTGFSHEGFQLWVAFDDAF